MGAPSMDSLYGNTFPGETLPWSPSMATPSMATFPGHFHGHLQWSPSMVTFQGHLPWSFSMETPSMETPSMVTFPGPLPWSSSMETSVVTFPCPRWLQALPRTPRLYFKPGFARVGFSLSLSLSPAEVKVFFLLNRTEWGFLRAFCFTFICASPFGSSWSGVLRVSCSLHLQV